MNKIIAAVLAVIAFFALHTYVVPAFPKLADEVIPPYVLTIKKQDGVWRGQLSERQQQLYDVIKAGVLDRQSEIIIKRLGYSDFDVEKTIWCVMQDSPEVFWLNWLNWTMRESAAGLTVSIESLFDPGQIPELTARLNQSIQDLLKQARDVKSDYERALLIHDYLAAHVTYTEHGAPSLHSAYGALAEGAAASDGFAGAVSFLLHQLRTEYGLNMENLRVNGRLRGTAVGAVHCWNIIQIGDVFCHMDIALDAVGHHYADDWPYAHAVSYGHFLLSDDQIAADFMPNNPVLLQDYACAGYGFFEKQNLQASGISDAFLHTVAEQLYKNIENGKKYYVEFRLLDAAERTKATDIATRYEYCQKGILDAVNTMLHNDGASFRIARFESPYVNGDCILLLAVPEKEIEQP